MSSYLKVVGYAVLFFPFAAAVIALPFLIHHYRKFGSMTFARFFLAYSFVLYGLCAYFLVILPLPSQEDVAQMTGPSTQLIPFSFFRDLSKETGFQWDVPSTYLSALLSNFTLQFVFNIALLVPLGFYLRYYFRRKLLTAVGISFGISLFFELTQLSGLYGVYPRAYRLFDVDDLICNTLGGFLGYVLTGPLMKILPDRDKIDENAYRKGERVTFTRRGLSFCVDLLFAGILWSLIKLGIPENPFLFGVAYLLYFGLLQWAWKGKSLGKRLTKLRVVNEDGSRVLFWRCLLRYGILCVFLYVYWGVPQLLSYGFSLAGGTELIFLFFIALWLFAGVFLFLLETVLNRSSSTGRDYLYGRISGTKLVSTVIRPVSTPSSQKG